MIVGAGHGHHLAEAHRCTGVFRHSAIFRRVVDGAGGDDGALSGHQAWNRADGADGAGVGERNGGGFEIGHRQFVAACAGDDVVISG